MSIRSVVPLSVAASLAVLTPVPVHDAKANESWPDITEPVAKQGGGEKDAAVIIGVEDYVFAPDIPGATNNAEAWYRHLTGVRGVPAQNVRLLRNEEATLEEMRTAAKDAASLAQPGGTVWFVFIGHGAPSKDGNDGLLVGTDAQQTATSLEARSLRRSELIASLETGKGQPVVVIDACFSGRGQQGEQLAEGLQPLRVADLEPPKSALILTAAKSNQYAGALPGKDVPAFSYLVLGAMRGWGDADGDGTVTAAEANIYASGVMRATIKGRTQSPELGGPSQTVLGTATETGPDISAIVLAGGSGGSDKGPGEPAPAPVRDAQGKSCVDQRMCPDGTTCIEGVCQIDYQAMAKRERQAGGMTVGGGVVFGLGAAGLIGVIATAAVVSSGGEGGIDSGGVTALSAGGAVALVATAVGGIVMGIGLKRRKEVRALKGEVSLSPTLGGNRNSAMVGLQGRF